MSKFKQSKEYFDRTIDEYADGILAIQPEFYQNSARLINNSIKNSSNVLDIGNGGIVNYNFEHLERLVCADLSLSKKAIAKYSSNKNIEFVQANILNMSQFQDNSFDTIIVSAVIHHLAETTMKKTNDNVETALLECIKKLKPDGQLLIVESTVYRWFELIERLLYPAIQLFFKICKFGAVYQYSKKSLCKKITDLGLNIEECCEVGIGKSIWIMERKMPKWLVPCEAVWIKISK